MRKFLTILLFLVCLQQVAHSLEIVPWQDGLQKLKASALNDSQEIIAAYVMNENQGTWIFPQGKDSTSDAVWVTPNELIELIQAAIKTLPNSKHESQQDVKVYFVHTHPLKTIQAFISDSDKKPEVFLETAEPQPLGRFSISPSRNDMATAYSLHHQITKSFPGMNVHFQSIVVGPAGLYYYRSFKNTDEKLQLFPNLAKHPAFEDMDFEAQEGALSDMNQQFFAGKVAWTTKLNLSNAPMSILKSSVEYKMLRLTYASYGIGTLLHFEEYSDQSSPYEE